MSFEYNGVVYRDLEPQVRYDAEQVQLLKQSDVTINENLQTVNESLQTINTEIDGKLTKPANPSAESAVTLLADGTVGTKLLSEIGGGEKLYLHRIGLLRNDDYSSKIYFNVFSLSNTHYTLDDLNNNFSGFTFPASIQGKYMNLYDGEISFSYGTIAYSGTIIRDMSGQTPTSWEVENFVNLQSSEFSITGYDVIEL